MGEAEVLGLLEKIGMPLSAREISTMLDSSESKIIKILNQMIKYHEVNTIELNNDPCVIKARDCKMKIKLYKSSKRMRLYYAELI